MQGPDTLELDNKPSLPLQTPKESHGYPLKSASLPQVNSSIQVTAYCMCLFNHLCQQLRLLYHSQISFPAAAAVYPIEAISLQRKPLHTQHSEHKDAFQVDVPGGGSIRYVDDTLFPIATVVLPECRQYVALLYCVLVYISMPI